jgi:hypothetical protein
VPAKVRGIIGQFSAYNRLPFVYVRYGGGLQAADRRLE